MSTKRWLIAGLIALWGATAAHAQSTLPLAKSPQITQINNCFPTQLTGAITPAILVECLTSIVNSYQQYTAVNSQAGTSYTIQLSDYGQLVTFNNSGAVAVSIPIAASTFLPFNVFVKNLGSGTVTITPTSGGTIGGNSTLTLAVNQQAWLIADGTGTNYAVFSGAQAVTCSGLPALTGDVTTSAASCATTVAKIQGTVVSGTSGNGNVAFTTSPSFTTPALGVATATSLAINGASLGGNSLAVSGPSTLTSVSAGALVVGPNGGTNPTLNINSSASSAVTGLSVVAAAAGSGLGLSVTSSGNNEALNLNAKGSGGINIGNVSTGAVTITPATTLSAALTYGGVTLSNSVTGTGAMVLATSPSLASPTFTGTVAGTNVIPFSVLATLGASSLLGNPTGSGTTMEAITLGTSLGFTGPVLACTTATSSVIGCARPDNSTITVSAGVLTAITSAAATITVNTTTVGSASGSNQVLTTGTVSGGTGTLANATIASLLTQGAGIAITGTSNATIAQSLTNATVQASLGNPSGITGTTIKLQGLGSSCKITPVYSGRVKFEIMVGNLSNNTSNINSTSIMYYGSGTAPSNGTGVGSNCSTTSCAAVGQTNITNNTTGAPAPHSAIVTGLSTGTAYWFDIAIASGTAGDEAIAENISCNAMEF